MIPSVTGTGADDVLKNVWKSDKSWEPEKILKFEKNWKFEKIWKSEI